MLCESKGYIKNILMTLSIDPLKDIRQVKHLARNGIEEFSRGNLKGYHSAPLLFSGQRWIESETHLIHRNSRESTIRRWNRRARHGGRWKLSADPAWRPADCRSSPPAVNWRLRPLRRRPHRPLVDFPPASALSPPNDSIRSAVARPLPRLDPPHSAWRFYEKRKNPRCLSFQNLTTIWFVKNWIIKYSSLNYPVLHEC